MIDQKVITRTRDGDIFAGTLVGVTADHVRMEDARRLWSWEGAATISQLATTGTSAPQKCKFPAPVPTVMLSGWVEITLCTPQGWDSIQGVPIWQV